MLPYRSPLNPICLPYGKCCALHSAIAFVFAPVALYSNVAVAPAESYLFTLW